MEWRNINYISIPSFWGHFLPTFYGILWQALCQCETTWSKPVSSTENWSQLNILITFGTSMISSKNTKIFPWWFEMSMHQWQNVNAQSVPMQRLNEQFINQIQWLIFKILSIHSQDILYVAIISQETVLGLGRDVPGHPAFIIILKWSLTILCERLFSAHTSRNMGSEVQIS